MSRDDVTIGIDIGTTAVKAVAADDNGRVTARVRIGHQLAVPAPTGWSTTPTKRGGGDHWQHWTGWSDPTPGHWPLPRWCHR
ncbi:D-xylulose kinase XylB [Mycobacterium tuberculosis variant bovis BCG]|nr:D-xylulose kinase XylB [Mycobacterium tuberculosis variant bovis BCG]